jgi:hypothetical protein
VNESIAFGADDQVIDGAPVGVATEPAGTSRTPASRGADWGLDDPEVSWGFNDPEITDQGPPSSSFKDSIMTPLPEMKSDPMLEPWKGGVSQEEANKPLPKTINEDNVHQIDSYFKYLGGLAGDDPEKISLIEQARKEAMKGEGVGTIDFLSTFHTPKVAPGTYQGKPAQMAAGAYNAVSGMVDFFGSPEGMAVLGSGNLPAGLRRAVSGAFAVDMARQTPGLVMELSKAWKEGDVQKATELAISSGMNVAFAKKAAEHAMAPEATIHAEALAKDLAKAIERAPMEGGTKVERSPGIEIRSPLPLTAGLVDALEQTHSARTERITTIPEAPRELEIPGTVEGIPVKDLANGETTGQSGTHETIPVSDVDRNFGLNDARQAGLDPVREKFEQLPAQEQSRIPTDEPASQNLAESTGQAPTPERFETIDDLLRFREQRRREEVDLYQKEIGLTPEEAGKLQEILARDGSTTSFERKIGADKSARLEHFFENSPLNQKDGPFQFWEFDRNYDPQELVGETDKGFVAERLVRALQREPEQSANNDHFLFSAIAARKFQELGGTQSDLARAVDHYTTRNSGSAGDKLEFFQSTTRKVGEFLRSQGVELQPGDLAKSRHGSVLRTEIERLSGSPSEVSETPAAVVEQKQETPQLGATSSPEPSKVLSMATGSTPSAPGAPSSPAPVPSRIPSLPKGSRIPLVSSMAAGFKTLRKALAPQTIDKDAGIFSRILRENTAQGALDLVRSDAALADYRRLFDRTPVSKDWVFDPGQPLPHNYAVIDALERSRGSLPTELQAMAQAFDAEFAWRINEAQRLAPDALQRLIKDYFPHMWEKPEKGASSFMAEVAARAPFHGSKAFLKQRTIEFFHEGLERGLKPISDNPVDLLLAKMHQMDRFILAQRTLQEAKAAGMYKYLPLGREMPEGWLTVKDPAFTVFAPPVMTMHEAFDAGIRRGLMDFIAKMGFKHERVAKLGVNQWGQYTTGKGEILSKFGSPDFVIMHEIGHGLDERYGLYNQLSSNAALKAELKALADERTGGAPTPRKFRDYIQTPEEQMANVLHAYLYAPELMEKVAPNVKKAFANIIRAHPELEDLNQIKPSLAMATGQSDFPLAGPVLSGHWIMPEGPAQVLENHLSPSLQRFMAFRTIRAASNILNAAQLGFSAFHVGFTSLDASISSVAVGLHYALTGDLKTGAKRIAAAPAVPMVNYFIGKAIQAKMIDPTSKGVQVLNFPKLGIAGAKVNFRAGTETALDSIAKLAVKGGLRASVDPFWQTTITRNMVRALHEGGAMNYGKSALKLPFAILEQSMRPISEFLVPRQKLGVFAQLAYREMERLGPGASVDDIRNAMAKAADTTEDRMGQMTYDNLFYQRWIKDLALIGFRAYGWQLGKYRAAVGAVTDSAKFITGNGELTNRMLYPVALAMVTASIGALVQYLATGKQPDDLKDYFFPRSGVTDPSGKEQRYALPTYLKDLVGEAKLLKDPTKAGEVLSHKMNPLISLGWDMMRNRDFYETEIRHPGDPLFKQLQDEAGYIGKTAIPFSVSGYNKLGEEGAPELQKLLPFIGIVPAKKSITMTAAEAKASEIIQAIMPAGARSKEQFEKSQMKSKLLKNIQQNTEDGLAQIQKAVESGIIRPQDARQIFGRRTLTPLEYQVKRMPADKAMEVWDLASPQERNSLKVIIIPKVAGSTVLAPEKKKSYLDLLNKHNP